MQRLSLCATLLTQVLTGYAICSAGEGRNSSSGSASAIIMVHDDAQTANAF
jgi:hypothetical protein